jgi:NAD(P)-dependent dehydrogenase (short-subunit alcohol dehydrogenase family)
MYQLTMLAVPHLISSRGNIVNVSSVNGIRPVSLIFSSTDGVGCKPTNHKDEGIFKELVCVAPLKNEKQLLKIVNNFFPYFQFTNVLAYNMSKAAVNQFTQCVAMGKS